MSNVDLLGDPLPEPVVLPVNERLTEFDQLVGHTIRAAFTDTCGRFDVSLVIVTETGCWLTADAEENGCDEPPILSVGREYSSHPQQTLADFVSARELFNAGCIGHGELELLKAKEAKRQQELREREAAALRARLARLEVAGQEGGAA